MKRSVDQNAGPDNRRDYSMMPGLPEHSRTGRIAAHHDALEFPDGEIVLLTLLAEGQQATVLQLPAEPKTTAEAESQTRAAYVG